MANKKYSVHFKIKVVEFYLNNHTVTETLQKFSVAESSLFEWKKQYQNRMLEKSCDPRITTAKHMQRRIDHMATIFELQEKLKLHKAITTADKVKVIDIYKDKYSVRDLCKAIDIPRGTYYNRKRREGYLTKTEKENECLKVLIKGIVDNSEYRLGKRLIKRILEKQGVSVGEERIAKLMKEMFLPTYTSQLMDCYTKPISRKCYKNRLKNEYIQNKPNAAWVSDITYIRVGEEYKYICVIMDLFSRMVLAYTVSENMYTSMILETFSKAFNMRGKPSGLLFHSDQGAQYTSYAFRSLLNELNVTQSFSNPGSPTQNAVVESFFARMKHEALYLRKYSSLKDVSGEVDKYVDYYNNRRMHRFLDFKTPAEMESEYYLGLKNC
jgi:transposase InsO family protein